MSKRLYPINRRRMPGRQAYVVTALRRKYAELKGLGDEAAMAHVGATLLLFSLSQDLAAIPAIRPYKGARERWMRTMLDTLRKANRPLTGRELAYAVMRERDVPLSDIKRLKSIECGLHGVLGRLEGQGRRQGVGKAEAVAVGLNRRGRGRAR